ncbi:hypothetical protein EN35_07355 [Rhodococcus qingshengii]|nr:hypothetical protein EN35_07355 [Rhodococcus qingshengii]
MIIGRFEAGSLADNTIDVDDLAAAATDEVMVVVTSSRLEPCGRTRRLDASQQSCVHACLQHVVNGLCGYRSELLPHECCNRIGV